MTNTATPAEWPEVRAGARSAIVCDGCHASLDQLVTNGHIGDCDHPDRRLAVASGAAA